MHTVKIGRHTRLIPSNWDELSAHHFFALGKIYPLADLEHLRLLLLIDWLDLGLFLGIKIRTLQAWQLTELTSLLDFVFEKPVIKNAVIDQFVINGKIHKGCSHELLDLSVGQWRVVEPLVQAFQKNKTPDLLNYIMAILYINPTDKSGKTWQQYAINMDSIAARWSKVPEFKKLGALLQYMGMREVLINGNSDLLPKPDSRTTAGAPPFDWGNLVMQMATHPGDIDRIDDMSIWVFLKYIKAKNKHGK